MEAYQVKYDNLGQPKLEKEEFDPKELEGYEVQFDYNGHLAERTDIYNSLKTNVFLLNLKIKNIENIGVYLYDLNNDEKKEIISYVQGEDATTLQKNCLFLFYDKINKFKSIHMDKTCAGRIKILSTVHFGYNNLLTLYKDGRPNGMFVWDEDYIAKYVFVPKGKKL